VTPGGTRTDVIGSTLTGKETNPYVNGAPSVSTCPLSFVLGEKKKRARDGASLEGFSVQNPGMWRSKIWQITGKKWNMKYLTPGNKKKGEKEVGKGRRSRGGRKKRGSSLHNVARISMTFEKNLYEVMGKVKRK